MVSQKEKKSSVHPQVTHTILCYLIDQNQLRQTFTGFWVYLTCKLFVSYSFCSAFLIFLKHLVLCFIYSKSYLFL